MASLYRTSIEIYDDHRYLRIIFIFCDTREDVGKHSNMLNMRMTVNNLFEVWVCKLGALQLHRQRHSVYNDWEAAISRLTKPLPAAANWAQKLRGSIAERRGDSRALGRKFLIGICGGQKQVSWLGLICHQSRSSAVIVTGQSQCCIFCEGDTDKLTNMPVIILRSDCCL